MMSLLKFVLEIGLQAIPGVGKALDAGLDMATTATQLATYLYSDEEKPEDAFSWWLSPCGGTELVPNEIKKIFDILSTVADGVSSFKTHKILKRGPGRKATTATRMTNQPYAAKKHLQRTTQMRHPSKQTSSPNRAGEKHNSQTLLRQKQQNPKR
jgi:hypothetical protein